MNDLNREGRPGSLTPHTIESRVHGGALSKIAPLTDSDPQDGTVNKTGSRARILINTVFIALWLGGLGAYLWGYFGESLFHSGDVRLWLSVAAAALVPIVLVAAATEITIQGRALAQTSQDIARITRRLSEPEGPALQRVAVVTNAVRRELDILSGSLDATLDRVAAVETLVENQVSAIERAGGRAQMRAQVIGELLGKERDALATIADDLTANAARIADTIQTQAARVNDANREATQSIFEAETSLTRQLQAFHQLAEDHAKMAVATVHDVETVAERLRDLSAASLESARGLTASIESQHETLANTTQKLDRESQRMADVFEHQGALIARIESAAQHLGTQLETVLSTATDRFDNMFGTLNTRTSAAGDALRAETEAAMIAGGNVASAIEEVAAKARVSSSSLREAIAAQIDAFNEALGEGLSMLDGAASATGLTLSNARREASGFSQSLDETVRGIEAAGDRLNAVLAGIGDRSEATRETLDDASRALAHHMSEVPDLAAEHASRISALLEDQAIRMAALANALGGRTGTPIAPQAPTPADTTTARLPDALLDKAPQASAAAILPLATAPSNPPDDHDEEETGRPDHAAPVPFTPMPLDQRTGLAAFGRIGRRLRQAAGIGTPGRGQPAAAAIEREPEIGQVQTDETPDEAPYRTPDEQTEQLTAPMALVDTTGEPEHGKTASGGFWSALFARIEGDDDERLVIPEGANLADLQLESEDDSRRVQHTLETLYAIAIDLDRLLEEEPPIDLWKRYRGGEADVFARRVLSLKGSGLVQRIRHKYRDDLEFREHADRYRARFAETGMIDDTPAARLNAVLEEALGPAIT